MRRSISVRSTPRAGASQAHRPSRGNGRPGERDLVVTFDVQPGDRPRAPEVPLPVRAPRSPGIRVPKGLRSLMPGHDCRLVGVRSSLRPQNAAIRNRAGGNQHRTMSQRWVSVHSTRGRKRGPGFGIVPRGQAGERQDAPGIIPAPIAEGVQVGPTEPFPPCEAPFCEHMIAMPSGKSQVGADGRSTAVWSVLRVRPGLRYAGTSLGQTRFQHA